jgi:epoxyqueuosine reductase
MVLSRSELTEELKRRAYELGFSRAGVARAGALVEDGARLNAWLLKGYQGPLDFMNASADLRSDPTHPGMLAGAKSVVALATLYDSVGEAVLSVGVGVARYAIRRDYHTVIHKRLAKLARFLRERGYRVRRSCDSMPVMERAWARLAGIGFIGKNSLLIVPGVGSYSILSTLITDADLALDTPIKQGCGRCRACLDRCPTEALVEPRVVDVRRCISALTKNQQGAIDPALRPLMGGQLFGCDLCQEVCPYNRTASARIVDHPSGNASHRAIDIVSLLQTDQARLDSQLQGLPVRGARRQRLARNAAIALGNTSDDGHLELLHKVAEADESDIVREAARWAIERIRKRVTNMP